MSLTSLIATLTRDDVKQYLQSQSIKHLWLFGSRAKNTSRIDSDVDLLYELHPTMSWTGFGFFGAIADLKEKLGLSVDMVSINAIHPDIRSEVLSSKIALW